MYSILTVLVYTEPTCTMLVLIGDVHFNVVADIATRITGEEISVSNKHLDQRAGREIFFPSAVKAIVCIFTSYGCTPLNSEEFMRRAVYHKVYVRKFFCKTKI